MTFQVKNFSVEIFMSHTNDDKPRKKGKNNIKFLEDSTHSERRNLGEMRGKEKRTIKFSGTGS